MVTMNYRPYPSPRRALRHIVRGYRLAHRTWRDGAGTQVEVHIYPGTMSKGIEAEVQRLLRMERSHRLGLR
jgi:hypothetical protein